MEEYYRPILDFFKDLRSFASELSLYLVKNLHLSFLMFESKKGAVVASLYRQRGKMARRLTHSGMAGLAALGIMIAPVIAQEFPGRSVNPWEVPSPSAVLSAATENPEIDTLVSDKVRDKIMNYTVSPGDTIKSIANKFGVSEDTLRWQNDLKGDKIKIGESLQILPVTGVSHKVQKGDTVYSIAKKYDSDPQAIVDFPFNTFANDETFELAIGQVIIVPDGVMPSAAAPSPRIRRITPDAGTVVASGQFVWPTSGRITQNFSWYHPGIDIANKEAPRVLAADSGRVIVAGWIDNSGYGSRVVIDHGNGYITRYAHLAKIYVRMGQSVNRGNAIGQMGTTGRSTGTHLHFEIIRSGVRVSPLNYLR